MTIRFFRQVTPNLVTGLINPDFEPYTDIMTGAVDNITSITPTTAASLSYSLWYFLWVNRWNNPAFNNKGNLPELETPNSNGEKYRFFFSTLLLANVATIAQFYSVSGKQQQAEEFCTQFGLDFVHWEDSRAALEPYVQPNQFGTESGFLDVVILYPHMPQIEGVVIDFETFDGRPESSANNIINRANNIIKIGAAKKLGLWMNRIGSPGAINSGLTNVPYFSTRSDVVFCLAFDENTPDTDGMEVIQDIEEQRTLVNDDSVFCPNVELNNNTLDDMVAINQYYLDDINADEELNYLSVWRFGADVTDATTTAEIDALLNGIELFEKITDTVGGGVNGVFPGDPVNRTVKIFADGVEASSIDVLATEVSMSVTNKI